MAELRIPNRVERDDLGAFVARAVRLDGDALVRLRAADGRVHAWVPAGRRTCGWRSALPPDQGWREVDQVPAEVLADLADQGAAVAKDNPGPHGSPSAALLDQKVITVSGAGFDVGGTAALPVRPVRHGFCGRPRRR